ESRQKSYRRLRKLGVEELDIAGGGNQSVSARSDAGDTAVFLSLDRLINDGVNYVGKRAYCKGIITITGSCRARHGRLTAIPQKAIRDALNRGSRRDTGANNRLADVPVRKMRRNQSKPSAGNGGRTLRCLTVIHSPSLIILQHFVPHQRTRRPSARGL